MSGRVRVGIGGWNFEPWRGTFYPPAVKSAGELAYAASKLTSIEINATFYRTQSATTFAKWRDATPDDFVFSLKAPRYACQRKDLDAAGPMIEVFVNSGVRELGPKLGPILWQLAPTRRFDAKALEPFLDLLPKGMRHVIEGRHESFGDPRFAEMLSERNIAAAIVDSEKHVLLEEPTADFVYARLQRTREEEPAGYSPAELDQFAAKFRARATEGRDAFVYFISGAKVRAPHAAMALIERLA